MEINEEITASIRGNIVDPKEWDMRTEDEKISHNPKQSIVAIELPALLSAAEFGFKKCQEGLNVIAMKIELQKILRGER